MSDKIVVKCANCGRQFRVPAELGGKKTRCSCGNIIPVPAAGAAESTQAWYYTKDGQRFGPVPLGELKGLLETGQVGPRDYVWTAGMASWQRAEEVEELAPPARLPEPDKPPAEVVVREAPAKEAAPKAAVLEEKTPVREAPKEKPKEPVPEPAQEPTEPGADTEEGPPRYASLVRMSRICRIAGIGLLAIGAASIVAATIWLIPGETLVQAPFYKGFRLLSMLGSFVLITLGLMVMVTGELIKLTIDARVDLWHLRRNMEKPPGTD